MTRDISTSGVYFVTDREAALSLAPGEVLTFFLSFDGLGSGRAVRVECEGTVMRIEECGSTVGVAVALSRYRFELGADRLAVVVREARELPPGERE